MKIFRDESGQTIVVAAFFMALLGCGFMALALDVGNLYRERRIAQATASAAAMAAATELGANKSANLALGQTAANAVATLNGLTSSTVVTLSSPTSGNYQGPYVTATVYIPVKTFFLGAFYSLKSTMTVSASATAGGGNGGGGTNLGQAGICSNGDLEIDNNSTVNVGSLGIFDSDASANIKINGSAKITANALATAGNMDTGSDWQSIYSAGDTITVKNVKANETGLTCDPTLPVAPTLASCTENYATDPGASNLGGSRTVSVGPANSSGTACYSGGLTIGGGNNTVTINPGIYIINGGTLNIAGDASGGNGVFFYLTNSAQFEVTGGKISLISGGSLESDGTTVTPSLGPNGIYNGLLVYQDKSDTSTVSFEGGSSTYMSGMIVAQGAQVTLGNGSGSTVSSGGIDAGSVKIDGGGTLKITTAANAGAGQVVNTPVFNAKPVMVQ